MIFLSLVTSLIFAVDYIPFIADYVKLKDELLQQNFFLSHFTDFYVALKFTPCKNHIGYVSTINIDRCKWPHCTRSVILSLQFPEQMIMKFWWSLTIHSIMLKTIKAPVVVIRLMVRLNWFLFLPFFLTSFPCKMKVYMMKTSQRCAVAIELCGAFL